MTVIALVSVVFLAGVIAGIIAMVSISIHREDRHLSLMLKAPDRVAAGARRLAGLAVRDLDVGEDLYRRR